MVMVCPGDVTMAAGEVTMAAVDVTLAAPTMHTKSSAGTSQVIDGSPRDSVPPVAMVSPRVAVLSPVAVVTPYPPIVMATARCVVQVTVATLVLVVVALWFVVEICGWLLLLGPFMNRDAQRNGRREEKVNRDHAGLN